MTRPATQRIAAAAAAAATKPQNSFGPGCGTRRGLRGKGVRPTSSSSPSGPMPIISAESFRSGSATSSSLRSRQADSHPAGTQHQCCPVRTRTAWNSHAIWRRCAAPKQPWVLPAAQARAAQCLLVPSWATSPAPKPVSLRVPLFLRNALSLGNLFQRACMHAGQRACVGSKRRSRVTNTQ